MILAYFGPETYLPMTSLLATVGGFVLLFGRVTLRFLGGIFHIKSRNSPH